MLVVEMKKGAPAAILRVPKRSQLTMTVVDTVDG